MLFTNIQLMFIMATFHDVYAVCTPGLLDVMAIFDAVTEPADLLRIGVAICIIFGIHNIYTMSVVLLGKFTGTTAAAHPTAAHPPAAADAPEVYYGSAPSPGYATPRGFNDFA